MIHVLELTYGPDEEPGNEQDRVFSEAADPSLNAETVTIVFTNYCRRVLGRA